MAEGDLQPEATTRVFDGRVVVDHIASERLAAYVSQPRGGAIELEDP
jgi:hypothetical protein